MRERCAGRYASGAKHYRALGSFRTQSGRDGEASALFVFKRRCTCQRVDARILTPCQHFPFAPSTCSCAQPCGRAPRTIRAGTTSTRRPPTTRRRHRRGARPLLPQHRRRQLLFLPQHRRRRLRREGRHRRPHVCHLLPRRVRRLRRTRHRWRLRPRRLLSHRTRHRRLWVRRLRPQPTTLCRRCCACCWRTTARCTCSAQQATPRRTTHFWAPRCLQTLPQRFAPSRAPTTRRAAQRAWRCSAATLALPRRVRAAPLWRTCASAASAFSGPSWRP